MSNPSKDTVKTYYDERIDGKLLDFTEFNPRIEAAVDALATWAPSNPKRILEIGCGIGATSWRMAKAWPDAQVIGADISPKSIEVAKSCFQLSNLTYRQGVVEPGAFEGTFDYIVLMDVYEHISQEDRPKLHEAIRSFMGPNSRVFFSVPTPECLQFAMDHDPSGLQPVDEHIGPREVALAAEDTASALLYYRKIGIWKVGDYAHFVLGRIETMSPFESRVKRPITIKRLVHSLVWRILKTNLNPRPTCRGDVFTADDDRLLSRFQVSHQTRLNLAFKWKDV